MKTYIASIKPQTAFVTPFKGDTLFGQLCWAIRNLLGEEKLQALLKTYDQQPFMVLSDALLSGYLPRPSVPSRYLGLTEQSASERKAIKKRNWVPLTVLNKPMNQWQQSARSDQDILKHSLQKQISQPHNSISRLSGTTGSGDFAPFQITQHWYVPGSELNLYIVLDEQQLELEILSPLLASMGASGFGKEASTGLGKFELTGIKAVDYAAHPQSNAWLTLAPCVPDSMASGISWNSARCFYQPFTRFGRHGDQLAVSGQPFKNPVLMADSAAVLTPLDWHHRDYIGNVVGGDNSRWGELSKAMPETVHQGYAPVIPVYMPQAEQE